MAEYDIFFGKPWHLDIQPQIQFKKNLLKLQDKHTTRHITMRCLYSKNDRHEEERPTIEFMSVKQARQALIKGGEYIIGKLESAELQATAIEIRLDRSNARKFRSCSTNTKAVFRSSSQKSCHTDGQSTITLISSQIRNPVSSTLPALTTRGDGIAETAGATATTGLH